jgi:monoamine oxidase
VSVETQHADGRTRPKIDASAAIVAVPLGVLKAPVGELGAIEFDPDLRMKQQALAHLEMGSVVRITLRLTERFWASDWFAKQIGNPGLDTLSFLHTADEHFPVWWSAYPVRAPIIVGWHGGPGARTLSLRASEEVEELAIASLARQSGIAQRRMRGLVEAAWMHDWQHDPFSRGAYSYQAVGGVDAPTALARPVRGTLFFAGEASDIEGRTGTVHGAIASGRRAAAEVERSLKTLRPSGRRAESD